MFQTIRAVVHVFFRPPFQSGAFCPRQLAHNFRRGAEDERAGRDFRSLRHQRLRADDGLFADDRAIQNHRAHADERFVADGAGVDDGGVADGDPVADDARKIVREVQHGVVLDIRVVADDDAVDVAAQHRAIPHAGMRAERHVANDDGGLGDEDIFAELRLPAEKFIELLCEFVHAGNLSLNAQRHNLKEGGVLI